MLTQQKPFSEPQFQTLKKNGARKLKEELKNGLRPTIPIDCLPSIAKLLKDCWNGDYALRPSFLRVVEVLKNIMEEQRGTNTVSLRKMVMLNIKAKTGEQKIFIQEKFLCDLYKQVTYIACIATQVWVGFVDGQISFAEVEERKGSTPRFRIIRKGMHAERKPVTCILCTEEQVWSCAQTTEIFVWDRTPLPPKKLFKFSTQHISPIVSLCQVFSGEILSLDSSGKIICWDPKTNPVSLSSFTCQNKSELATFQSLQVLTINNKEFVLLTSNQSLHLLSWNHSDRKVSSLGFIEIPSLISVQIDSSKIFVHTSSNLQIFKVLESPPFFSKKEQSLILCDSIHKCETLKEPFLVCSKHSTLELRDLKANILQCIELKPSLPLSHFKQFTEASHVCIFGSSHLSMWIEN